jgi:hypothetical protein
MHWKLTNRADPRAARIADQNSTRQSIGSRQFVPPGRSVVLIVPNAPVLWVSSWPYAKYVQHAWAGAWICSLFRNEEPSGYLSSELITQAVSATRAGWEPIGYTQGGLLALRLLPDRMPEAVAPLGFAAQLSLLFGEESEGGTMTDHIRL